MNSLATEKEMETERSAPRLDRALDVTARSDIVGGAKVPSPSPAALFRAPLAPHPLSAKTTKRVAHHVLKRASEGTRRLINGPLLSRLPDHAYLSVVSAFLALRDTPSQTSGRKRRGGGDRGVISSSSECAGVVYGCCLGSLVAYLHIPGVSVAFTVRQIEAVLSPVASAALKTRGVDARLLCTGLASSRMLRTQISYLNVLNVPMSLHSRNGNPSTMIGVCASIFVVFSVLSSSMLGSVDQHDLDTSIQWMVANRSIERVLEVANETAEGALPLDGWTSAPKFEIEALDAEQRAIQRAIRAVSCARQFSERHGLAPCSTFRKMLDWYSMAAWPVGELLNERTHPEILAKLSTVDYYLAPPSEALESADAEISDVVPLEQLSGLAERSGRSHTDSDTSSVATGSSGGASSAGSRAALADVASVATLGLDTFFDVRIV